MELSSRVSFVWNLMRYSYGAIVLVVGLDKIFGTNLVVAWPKYVSPFIASFSPFDVSTLLIIVGIIEVIVAMLAFSRFSVFASYVSAAWLVLISINLLMIGGYFDVAVRDLLLAIGAVSTAQLGQALGHGLFGKTHA